MLEPEIFGVLHKIKPSANGEYHLADALRYLINQGKQIGFIKIDTWRININAPDDLKAALSRVSRFAGQKG